MIDFLFVLATLALYAICGVLVVHLLHDDIETTLKLQGEDDDHVAEIMVMAVFWWPVLVIAAISDAMQRPPSAW